MIDWREELIGAVRARTIGGNGRALTPATKRAALKGLWSDIESGHIFPLLPPADKAAAFHILRQVRADILEEQLRGEVLRRTFLAEKPISHSIAERDLNRLLAALEKPRKGFSDLSEEEREVALLYVHLALQLLPARANGHPTGNPAAASFKLVDDFVRREILPNCPNLDPEKDTRGKGKVGRAGFLERVVRMVRDAPAAPCTPGWAIEVRRELLGSDEELNDYMKSWQRSDRRRRATQKDRLS